MHIHLNGFDFEFSKHTIASFIHSDDYLETSADIAGIHLSDLYSQMVLSGIDKKELVNALLNFHISTLHEEGVELEAISKENYKDVNISFLIDLKSDSFARFLNFNDEKTEDSVIVYFRNFHDSINLKYSDLVQLEERYRSDSPEQLLMTFLETYNAVLALKPELRQPQYATLAATGLLLFTNEVNTLDAIQYDGIELELSKDKLLLNLPSGMDTSLFELTFETSH